MMDLSVYEERERKAAEQAAFLEEMRPDLEAIDEEIAAIKADLRTAERQRDDAEDEIYYCEQELRKLRTRRQEIEAAMLPKPEIPPREQLALWTAA